MPKHRLADKLPRPLKKRLRHIMHIFWALKHRSVFLLCQWRLSDTIRSYTCANIAYLDQQPPLRRLAPAQTASVYPPRTSLEAPQREQPITVPALNLYRIEDAIIHPHSSHIITPGRVILERIPYLDQQHCNYATGAIVRHDQQRALYRRRPLEQIEQGILIAGNGACNYYHWLTEILPKLSEVCRHQLFQYSHTLLLPACARSIPTFARSVEAVLGEHRANIIYLDPQQQYQVSQLYTLTSPSCILFNPRKILASPTYNYYRKESLLAIRHAIEQQIARYDPAALQRSLAQLQFEQKDRRLYLARKPDTNRAYNQQQVRRLLVEQHNYCEVYLEDHPLEVQAWLFANARVIVGASGAAWANLIFCRPGTRAISWLPRHLMQFSAYSTLAQLFGVQMEFIEASTTSTSQLHPDQHLPLNELAQRL